MSIEELYKLYKAPLFSLAYRMLGSVMDAEDIVQEAFLSYERLQDADAIRNERAYLYKIVTNRCLDLLRSSVKKRELYVGPWLPEPLIERGASDGASVGDPSDTYLRSESISTAYLLLLQQLNAMERAVFLLREIFQYSFEEIADMVGKSNANCRQIFHRAKKSIHFDPDQQPSVSTAEKHIKDFVASLLQGDTTRLLELVSEDVVFYSDGGGKVKAAQVPVVGFELVLKFHQFLIKTYAGRFTYSFLMVNGLPGIRFLLDETVQYVYSFAYRDQKIQTIYTVANPDKLRHLSLG
ncbi:MULTISPECIES: RNA polymerase sigma factor SigJ [Paenibacillus]|uniref:RNA polymerase sigma-70 factor (ECF subfamily) n=1 Tax=Paenibacillus lactis TaxID=228574 RepID=A0ABS4FGV1_9BACL|nr:RNA polymerase sigma factor SigJ [Paenibacillus lactis]MBP1895462.1 RNA polymerase sigma-70 factor (ECF subfamily) [Paenibacillus lactis]HAF98778.1 RNA polymerase sigma factor SigJ [Paenibacillus lactis]